MKITIRQKLCPDSGLILTVIDHLSVEGIFLTVEQSREREIKTHYCPLRLKSLKPNT